MSALAAEYREVFLLYLKVGKELTRIMGIDVVKDPRTFVESLLANCESLSRIERLNSRILRLSEDWAKYRTSADAEMQDEVHELVQAVKAQAIRLRELCTIHAQKLISVRSKLARDIAEIGKGEEHLKSVKPVSNNYPKFIDSLY